MQYRTLLSVREQRSILTGSLLCASADRNMSVFCEVHRFLYVCVRACTLFFFFFLFVCVCVRAYFCVYTVCLLSVCLLLCPGRRVCACYNPTCYLKFYSSVPKFCLSSHSGLICIRYLDPDAQALVSDLRQTFNPKFHRLNEVLASLVSCFCRGLLADCCHVRLFVLQVHVASGEERTAGSNSRGPLQSLCMGLQVRYS